MPPLPPNPPTDDPANEKTLAQVVDDVGIYPVDAYRFIQEGLGFAVRHIHGEVTDPRVNRHITGQQLCEALREFALTKWGLLAGTVLLRWQIRSTLDFGRIVFALVESGQLSKTNEDTIEDFRNVYDFRSAFDANYRIEIKS